MIKRLLAGLAFAMMLTPFNASATDLPFVASITIYAPIVITETAPLSFPATEALAAAQQVVVAPGGVGAATFTVSGAANMGVNATIVENSVSMVNGATTIVVDTFTFGGGLTDVVGSGTGTLDATGTLVGGASVGATATIPANPVQGVYTGNLTFQVTYQ